MTSKKLSMELELTVNRFGIWRKALEEFVNYITKEEVHQTADEVDLRDNKNISNEISTYKHKTKRDIN